MCGVASCATQPGRPRLPPAGKGNDLFLMCVGAHARLGGGHGCSASDALPAMKAAAAVRKLGLPTPVNLTSPLLANATAGLDTIVVPSQHWLTLTDQQLLSAFAADGGCVIRHGVETSTFSAVTAGT